MRADKTLRVRLLQDGSEASSGSSSDYDLSSGEDEEEEEEGQSDEEDDVEWDPTMATPGPGMRRGSSRQRSVRATAVNALICMSNASFLIQPRDVCNISMAAVVSRQL